jgi:hypothetical protein
MERHATLLSKTRSFGPSAKVRQPGRRAIQTRRAWPGRPTDGTDETGGNGQADRIVDSAEQGACQALFFS